MKQSDIFSLILVASVGTLVAFFACRAIMGDPNNAQTKFTTVNKVVSAALAQPDPEIFNSTAINPTIEVYVGECEDIDQNGILDQAELAACARDQEENTEEGEEAPEGE